MDKIPCRLCRTCPFRPGNERRGWMPGSRQALERGLQHPWWLMECHDQERAACAGFVACLGEESFGVRLAIIRGRLIPPRPIPGAVRSFQELCERARGAENWE